MCAILHVFISSSSVISATASQLKQYSCSPSLTIGKNKMAMWTCDICSIEMRTQNQSSHLAGRRHTTRAKQIQAATGAFSIEDREYFGLSYSQGLTEASNAPGRTRQFSSTSTPATRHEQNSRAPSLSTGSSRATIHNARVTRSSNLGREIKNSDGPATARASHTASLAQSVPGTALAAYECTAEDIAKPQDFISAQGSSYVLVWECKPCNR